MSNFDLWLAKWYHVDTPWLKLYGSSMRWWVTHRSCFVLVFFCKVFAEPPVRCRAHIQLFRCPGRLSGSICKHPRLSPRARRSRFPHMQPTMLLLHLPPTIPPLVRSAYWALKKSFHTLPCFRIAWLTHSRNTIATIWVTPLLNRVRAFTRLLLACALFIYRAYVFIVSWECVFVWLIHWHVFTALHVAQWQYDEVTQHQFKEIYSICQHLMLFSLLAWL